MVAKQKRRFVLFALRRCLVVCTRFSIRVYFIDLQEAHTAGVSTASPCVALVFLTKYLPSEANRACDKLISLNKNNDFQLLLNYRKFL